MALRTRGPDRRDSASMRCDPSPARTLRPPHRTPTFDPDTLLDSITPTAKVTDFSKDKKGKRN